MFQTEEKRHTNLYKRIPPVENCIKRCSKCCVSVGMTDWEAERLGLKGHRFTPTHPNSKRCIFSNKDGCTVYDKRPFICRIFGAGLDPKLKCPKKASSKTPLTIDESNIIAKEYYWEIHTEKSCFEIASRP